ncbi:MAG: choice-of-anchor J domain-containing protein [Prevotella sp.]|nr:choice-of-anchor J domain-containing protein [Prevotella sp.]
MKKSLFSRALLTMVMSVGTMFAHAQSSSAVVTTMDRGDLRPLQESPQQPQQMLNMKRRLVEQKQVRRVADDYKMPAQIYGLLVYSRTWPNGSGTGKFGVYTFTADNPNGIQAVVKNDDMAASGGAIYANGRYHILNYESLWGTIILSYDYLQYSTQYWDLLQHVHQDDVTRLMSVAGVYDPTTENYYAIMYTDDMQHQVFGTLDYAQNSRQVIRQLPDTENVCAMAVSNDGTLYAIRFDGQLVKVNKANGRHTVVGATGITPKYLQSAAIDPRTDRMFWAACSDEDPVGLYEVNLETGEALLIQTFRNSEELVGLYIPMPEVAEDAPAQPQTITASFSNDELTGTVNFRLPRTTYAGDDITETTLGYRVYVDSVLVADGSAEPGALVKPEVTVSQSKTYRFEACAYNNAGEGPKLHIDKFVGKDQPKAPTNIKLVKTTEERQLKLTWNAPSTQGVNKGYVDREQLSYTVVRMPDSVVVAERTTERTFTETIETEALKNYYYTVTAYNGDIQGLPGESNRIILGSVVEPPYTEDFEDLTVVPNMYTFIDANHDGNTWRGGFWNGTQNSDVYYQYNENGTSPADDWVVTPPVHLKANRFYAISFDVNGSYFGYEKVSAWMGDDKTVAAMTTELMPTTNVDWIEQRRFCRIVNSDADGTRYFGFHAQSDADQGVLELDNISIEERGVYEAPDTVTAFSVTPGRNGTTNAVIAFKAPTTDFYGNAISEIEKIVVLRNGQQTQLIEHPEPGSEHSFRETSLTKGMNTWEIYTYNGHGCGIPATCSVWIGEDIPTEPEDLTLTMVGNTARLAWRAPKTGIHGGYINTAGLTYNIEDMNSYIKGDHRAGTTFSENRGTKQEFLNYRVSAQSSTGGGNYAYSNTVISGTPYKLPFSESFAGATTQQLWSQQNTGGQIGLTTSISADGDQGAALFKPAYNGDVGMITSGKIKVSTALHPILECYYYAVPQQQTSLTIAVVPDGDSEQLQALKTIDYTSLQGTEGWRKVTVSLEDYLATQHILLSFIGRATGSRVGDVAFDAIVVREQDDIDLAVASVKVPSMVEAGTRTQAVATIYNNGRLVADNYKVCLSRNGEQIAETEGKQLAAGTSRDFTFDIQTQVVDSQETNVEVSVVANGDGNTANDKMSACLSLDMPLFPVPTAAIGTEKDGELNITWTAPDLTPRNIFTTDDFERYQPFIIDGVGRWTMLDSDGEQTLAMQTGADNTIIYDHVGEPMAFQVFNADKAGLQNVTALQAHSGEQMLINILEANNVMADDWLISPILPATEQTISFWVRSMDDNSIETFSVMASQTDSHYNSFSPVETNVTKAPAAWTKVSAMLPEGTTYFAIRVHNRQKFMVMVDDIEYAPMNTAGLILLGYNVYLAGERLNDVPLTNLSYIVPWFGEADYRITAVYQQGESAPSLPVSFADGITTINNQSGQPNRTVYDLQGRRVSQRKTQPGVYIVNDRKVVVK